MKKVISILVVLAVVASTGCLESIFNRIPIADFSISGYFEAGAPIRFKDASSDYDGNITEWFWDFGDGNSSIEQNPTHVYAALGNYMVQLTVKDNLGKTNAASRQISIADRIRIREGDYVEIDYIGRYQSNGSVFDTSIYSVALDANKTGLPLKNESAYIPLKVYIARNQQDYPKDLNYTNVIEGLREGLMSMTVGENKTIIIPPEKGYGVWAVSNFTRRSEYNITEMYSNQTAEYKSLKQSGLLYEGALLREIKDAENRTVWNVTVIEATNESVTIRRNVVDSTQYEDVYGFNYTITVLNETKFQILTTAVVGYIFEVPGWYGTTIYKILEQNETSIEIGMASAPSHVKYLINETLVFEVNVVSIVRK